MSDLRTRLVKVFHDAATNSCATEDDWNLLADAVIRELNLAKACEGGCVWQIPSRFEDMTPQQRKLIERGNGE